MTTTHYLLLSAGMTSSLQTGDFTYGLERSEVEYVLCGQIYSLTYLLKLYSQAFPCLLVNGLKLRRCVRHCL